MYDGKQYLVVVNRYWGCKTVANGKEESALREFLWLSRGGEAAQRALVKEKQAIEKQRMENESLLLG